LIVAAACSIAADSANACAVCFGDPESDMTQGAKAGVVFLAVVVYGVLFSIAGIAGLWTFKARKIAIRLELEKADLALDPDRPSEHHP
jgi:hypothetical protein